MSLADDIAHVLTRPRLTIDLDAAARNLRAYRARSHGAEVGATVKADAYGLGMDVVAPRLFAEGCRTFFVANAEEGLRLRQCLGPDAMIYVYNGILQGEASVFLHHALSPVLNDIAQIEAWTRTRDLADAPPPAALHIDTGMNRLGVSARDAPALAARGDLLSRAGITLVMSHLACADEPEHSLNAVQRDTFTAIRKALSSALPNGFRASLANSAGVHLGADFCLDLVRPGIGLYGGSPGPDAPADAVVATLEAPILQVRQLEDGDPVGYGASCRAVGRRLSATVALGYADGFLRAGGPHGYGVLAGVKTPILGRISMDLVTVDVTDATDAARPGALIEFLGAQAALEDAAQAAQTLNYELLTGLGPRCDRRVLGAAA